MGEQATLKRAVTWLGGPWDGARTLVEPQIGEYAVAYDRHGERILGPKVQLYVTDPSFWMKERDRRVTVVHVFPIAWNETGGDIRWHSKNYRIIEVGAGR